MNRRGGSILSDINPDEIEYLFRVRDLGKVEYILNGLVERAVRERVDIYITGSIGVAGPMMSKKNKWEEGYNRLATMPSAIMPMSAYDFPTTNAQENVKVVEKVVYKDPPSAVALAEALGTIKKMSELLEGIRKEPLILQRIDRLTKDKKHCYVKKVGVDLRIQAPADLKSGDEVLLHPKTFQIVEVLGRPPLEVSRFAPDVLPDISWEQIGGLEQAKADLREAVELPYANKDLFTYYKKKPIKGILLSGPPGCGKTMLGKAAASSLSRTYGKEASRTGFLYVKGPEILDKFVGESESTIRDLFYDAKRHKEEHGYPAVVFIDEADAILAARGTRNVGIGNTIVPMFLTEMDGLEESTAIVILATNIPECLDPAIIRDGRIDRRVMVTRPSETIASEIIRMNLSGVPLEKGLTAGIVAGQVAAMIYDHERVVRSNVRLSDLVNGAMLVNVVNIAVSYAIQRDIESGKRKGVTMPDFLEAVGRIQRQSHMLKGDE